MTTLTMFSRFCTVLCTVLLLAVVAAPSHAQDEKIVTGVEMSKEALQRFSEMNEMDARSIIDTLNEGLFALKCASPKKMRAVVMVLAEDEQMRVESESVELEPGTHPVAVMWGGNYARLEERLADLRYEPGSTDAHSPERAFTSEEEMAETMRDEMRIGDGRVGLIMFLTVADRERAEEMGDALQIRPMGLAFNAESTRSSQ